MFREIWKKNNQRFESSKREAFYELEYIRITGKAKFIEDPELRVLAVKVSPYTPAERYVLFEFELESAVITEYMEGQTLRKRWKVAEERK